MDFSDIKLLEDKMLFQGKWRGLRHLKLQKKLFNTGEHSAPIDIELAECGEAVVCIPYIAETDEIILNKQFRAGVFSRGKKEHSPYIYELCAGIIDKKSEGALETAKRELIEETGSKAKDIEFFMETYASPGYSNELFHFFCADVTKPEEGIFSADGENEDIKTIIMPAAKAIEMCDNGEILSTPAVLAINWFARNHERLKAKWGNK